MIPESLRRYVMGRDRKRCQQCGDTRQPQVDHVYPRHALRAVGIPDSAQNSPENLQVLCADCNKIKSDRIPTTKEIRAVQKREEEYRMTRGLQPLEVAEAHRLVVLFGDLVQDYCTSTNKWDVWDNFEHKYGDDRDRIDKSDAGRYHGHWPSRVYIYALRGATEELVEWVAAKALREGGPDFWIHADALFRQQLGVIPGTKSAAEMAGRQLELPVHGDGHVRSA